MKMTLIEKTKYYELHEDRQEDTTYYGVFLLAENGQVLFNAALQNQYDEAKFICDIWQENRLLCKQLGIDII